MPKILHHVAQLPQHGPTQHTSTNIKLGVQGFSRLVESGAGFIPSTDSAVTTRPKKVEFGCLGGAETQLQAQGYGNSRRETLCMEGVRENAALCSGMPVCP